MKSAEYKNHLVWRYIVRGSVLTLPFLFYSDFAVAEENCKGISYGQDRRCEGSVTYGSMASSYKLSDSSSTMLDKKWIDTKIELPFTPSGSQQYNCGEKNPATPCTAIQMYIWTIAGSGNNYSKIYPSITLGEYTASGQNDSSAKLKLKAFFTGDTQLMYEGKIAHRSDYSFASKTVSIGSTNPNNAKTSWGTGIYWDSSFACPYTGKYDCHQTDTLYFTPAGSAKLHLAIQLTNTTSRDNVFSFDFPALTLTQKSESRIDSMYYETSSTIRVSGTITIPNRCYIDSNTSIVDWKTSVNNATEYTDNKVGNHNIVLVSKCEGVRGKITQQVYVEREAANKDNIRKYAVLAKADNNTDVALGLALSILDGQKENEKDRTASCSGNNLRSTFEEWHPIGEIDATNKEYFARIPISFALCKFGSVPVNSSSENKTATLTIKTKWVLD